MAQTFNCPNCGGNLEYSGSALVSGEQTIPCAYCGNTVPVPEEFWQPVEMAKTAQTVSRWSKYFIAFLIIVFVVPTCLGIIGTLLGIGGSIIGAIFAVIAPFLFR
jgi:hypothetical protein